MKLLVCLVLVFLSNNFLNIGESAEVVYCRPKAASDEPKPNLYLPGGAKNACCQQEEVVSGKRKN